MGSRLPRRMASSYCGKTGKQRYSSYFEAKANASAIRDQTAEDHGSPYRCEHCGDWHLGRSSFDRPRDR
jgi:predicted RNA-binding Zn-ribbon protein involved in translation (DUF1610 family)